MYNAGYDVGLDLIKEYAWYSVAAAQGHELAQTAKEQMEWVYMSRERIPEAVAAEGVKLVFDKEQFLATEEIAKAKALARRYQEMYMPAQRN